MCAECMVRILSTTASLTRLAHIHSPTEHHTRTSETIDTPANRAAMPQADTSSWTPPSFIAEHACAWSLNAGPQTAANGDALIVRTRGGRSEWRRVHAEAKEL